MVPTFLALKSPGTTHRQQNATQIEELGTKPLANRRKQYKMQQKALHRAAALPSTSS